MFNGIGLHSLHPEPEKSVFLDSLCSPAYPLVWFQRPRLKKRVTSSYVHLLGVSFYKLLKLVFQLFLFSPQTKPQYCSMYMCCSWLLFLAVLCYIHTSTCLLIYSPTDGNKAISVWVSYRNNCSVGSFTRTLFLWCYISLLLGKWLLEMLSHGVLSYVQFPKSLSNPFLD